MSDRFIAPEDRERSCTAHSLNDVREILSTLGSSVRGKPILDVGCGFGGLALTIGEHVAASEVHGLDIDRSATDFAAARGVKAICHDISKGETPYAAGQFSLVTCFGMLDYLPHYDDAILEMRRVLAPGGYLIVSLPNLASWHNRLLLLLGYQPRDVEVSREYLVGVHPHYRSAPGPVGHIHTVTTRAFEELMQKYDFHTELVRGAAPHRIPGSTWLRVVDDLFARTPTLARRFFYVGRKE